LLRFEPLDDPGQNFGQVLRDQARPEFRRGAPMQPYARRRCLERGQAADRQVQCLVQAGAGGLAAGILLWLILPGAIARSLPESWHVPEWMAARTMGMSKKDAAQRLWNVAGTEQKGWN